MITAKLQSPVTLVLWEEKKLDQRRKEGDEWVKTGEKEVFTEYTFRDEFGQVLKFMQKGDGLRYLEGSEVELTLEINYNDYDKSTKVKVASVVQLAS